jgi:hypothetical protein
VASIVLLAASPCTKYALLEFGQKPIRITTVEEIAHGLIHGPFYLSQRSKKYASRNSQ